MNSPYPTVAADFIRAHYEPGDYLCFAFQQVNGDGKGKWTQAFRTFEDALLPGTLAAFQKSNEAGHNVYIAMNSYQPGVQKRTEENIAAIRNVWCELDADGRQNLEKIFSSTTVPDPTTVNESSPEKFHAIWKVNDMPIAEAKALLRAICTEFGGDSNAIDAARVLRLPGFKNHKYPEAPEVEVVHLSENNARHTLADFQLERKPVAPQQAVEPVPESETVVPVEIESELSVGSGERDNRLASLGGSLCAWRRSTSEIIEALHRVNNEHVHPPLPGEDVDRIAKSTSREAYRKPLSTGTIINGKETTTENDVTNLVGLRITKDAKVVPIYKTAEQIRADEKQRIYDEAVEQQALQRGSWRDYFVPLSKLEDGDVRMLIADFLCEGTHILCGAAGDGKSLLALSIVKALTTGERLMGKWAVLERTPVIYMIPESSGRAFKKRCRAFGIPDDSHWFNCRTISEGRTIMLDDPILKEAVKELKPVLVLDTLPRFNEGGDENDAASNKKLVDDITELRALGVVAIICIHHSTKEAKKNGKDTLENVVRGTGDLGAMCDLVYYLRRDDIVFRDGDGPHECEVKCKKGRDLEEHTRPFKFAASYKNSLGKIVRYTNESNDLHIVESFEAHEDLKSKFMQLVLSTENERISKEKVAEKLGLTDHAVRKLAEECGLKRGNGPNGKWEPITPPPTPTDDDDENDDNQPTMFKGAKDAKD